MKNKAQTKFKKKKKEKSQGLTDLNNIKKIYGQKPKTHRNQNKTEIDWFSTISVNFSWDFYKPIGLVSVGQTQTTSTEPNQTN